MKGKRILVVDDHQMFAEGLVGTLGTLYVGVDMAHDIGDMRRRLKSNHYDLVTLDLTLHAQNALPLLQELVAENPKTRFLIVTASAQRVLASAAIRAGAIGYLIKESSTAELLRGVERALNGVQYVSAKVRSGAKVPVGQRESQPVGGDSIHLTSRELEVVELIHAGEKQKAAAALLDINVETVAYHLREARRRLGLSRTSMLIRWYEEYLNKRTRRIKK